MNRVVLYDLRLEAANTRRLPDGRYEVTLRIAAAKDENGKPLPLRESIDVGLFAADETRLHLAKHPLHEGTQELKIIVDREPLIAAVDPYLCRIDRNRFDNSRRIDTKAAAAAAALHSQAAFVRRVGTRVVAGFSSRTSEIFASVNAPTAITRSRTATSKKWPVVTRLSAISVSQAATT
jgi:hypothetical protein